MAATDKALALLCALSQARLWTRGGGAEPFGKSEATGEPELVLTLAVVTWRSF